MFLLFGCNSDLTEDEKKALWDNAQTRGEIIRRSGTPFNLATDPDLAMSDAEKKAHDAAIAAFKAKGGKVKKLKPGYAQGYHGKADPAAGMKGMMDKGDTKAFGTRKKIGSMK